MFDLRKTIWAPRCTWSDSKDFYDTDDVKQKRFALDWKVALDSLGLARLILQSDKDGVGGEWEESEQFAEEVEEVGAVLWESADLIFRLFTYYACIGDDIFGMSFNEWTQFVGELKLADKRSKLCKKRDLDRIFLTIDSTSARYWVNVKKSIAEQEKAGKLRDEKGNAVTKAKLLAENKESDKVKALSRVEFLGALVHVAIAKYAAIIALALRMMS